MTDAAEVEVSVPSGGDDAPTPPVDPEPAAAAIGDAAATTVSTGAGAGAGAGSSSAEAPPGAKVCLDLHFAVWDNDVPRLEALLATGRYDIEARDAQQNTPLLLSYFLNRTEAAKVLLAAGAAAKARAKGGWEAVEVASLTGNPHLLRIVVAAMLRETDAAWVRRLPALLPRLASIEDYCVEMTWSFKSWLPLVNRVLPTDDVTMWKRGSSMRMDTTLLGFSGMKWKRGHLTFVMTGADTRKPGDLLVMDRDNKTASSFRKAMLKPRDKEIQNWVRSKLTNKIKQTDWRSHETVVTPRMAKGWFGFSSAEQQTEDVGRFMACKVYDVSKVVLHTDVHPKICSKEEIGDWWRPSYSLYNGEAEKEAWWRTNHTIFSTPATSPRPGASTDDGAEGSSTLATAPATAGAGAGAGAGAEAEADATAPAASPTFTDIHMDETEEIVGADAEVTAEALAPIKQAYKIAKKTHDASGPEVTVTPAEEEVPGDAPLGAGACFKRTTLTDYFGAEAASAYHKAKVEDGADAVLVIENNIGVFDPAKIRHETKTFNNVKVVYSKEFPLSVDELLPIAEVMSRTQRHWVNFERFLKTKMPEGAGFPVMFSIPVFPTIRAEITFKDCRRVSPPQQMFEVPSHFKVGAYADNSIFNQL